MITTTSTMNLSKIETLVTFVGGQDYGFCLDSRSEGQYIAIVGVTSKSDVEIIGGIAGLVRNDAKGVFVAREVVRRLNADEIVESRVSDAIRMVRAVVGH